MLSDNEVWVSAVAMVRRYGRDAALQAGMRIEVFAAEGERDAQRAWLRIGHAIAWLQDEQRPRSASAH